MNVSSKCHEQKNITRMHSSRMRTGRSMTVSCSLLPGGGGSSLLGGSTCSGGCLPGPRGGSPRQSLPGGVLPAWSRGRGSPCLVLGGGSPCLVLGGALPAWSRGRGGACPETPPVNRITDTCKNITLATTSLRPVKMFQLSIPSC